MEKDIEEELTNHGRLSDPEEDIHSAVERRLHAHIGDSALRLHTARSRNDQSATDTRLWMLASIQRLHSSLVELVTVSLATVELPERMTSIGQTRIDRPFVWLSS